MRGNLNLAVVVRTNTAMRNLLIVAAFVTMTALPDPAAAAVCLGRSMTFDEITATLKRAPGCDTAMALFRDCASGSGGDAQLGDAVARKCEGDFLKRLKASHRRAYAQALHVCAAKYRSEPGTMYRSFEAFCRAEAAQRYSRAARRASADVSR